MWKSNVIKKKERRFKTLLKACNNSPLSHVGFFQKHIILVLKAGKYRGKCICQLEGYNLNYSSVKKSKQLSHRNLFLKEISRD